MSNTYHPCALLTTVMEQSGKRRRNTGHIFDFVVDSNCIMLQQLLNSDIRNDVAAQIHHVYHEIYTHSDKLEKSWPCL